MGTTMAEPREQREIIDELEAALEREEDAEKNYHIRQALQLLELDDESDGEGCQPTERSS